MNVIVTGGSGYLGTHIRKYFDSADLSRRSGGDVLDRTDVKQVADYDLVIHLAAKLDKTAENAEAVFETNVSGTVNVLRNVRPEAAFVFASTKDVYGRFADQFECVPESCPTAYAGQSALEWSDLIAERYVEYYAATLGFRACIFRLSSVFAPPTEGNAPGFVGHYANAINMGERIRLPGGGRPVRDILCVDDVSRACEEFAGSVIRNGLYNLGGGPENAFSLSEIVSKLESISGLQALIDEEPLPDPVPMRYVSDLSLVTRELGWRPTRDLDRELAKLFPGMI